MKRIIQTDNYGGDYPDESFLPVPPLPEADAEAICEILNKRQPQPRSVGQRPRQGTHT